MSSISAKIPDMVLCMVSIMVRMLCMVAIIGGNWAEHLRHERIQLIEVFDEIVQFIAKSRQHRRLFRIRISATSRWECRSSAFPSRSSCGSACRNPRNPRCDPATLR